VFEPRLVIEEVKGEVLSRRSLKSKDEYLRQYIVVRLYLFQKCKCFTCVESIDSICRDSTDA